MLTGLGLFRLQPRLTLVPRFTGPVEVPPHCEQTGIKGVIVNLLFSGLPGYRKTNRNLYRNCFQSAKVVKAENTRCRRGSGLSTDLYTMQLVNAGYDGRKDLSCL